MKFLASLFLPLCLYLSLFFSFFLLLQQTQRVISIARKWRTQFFTNFQARFSNNFLNNISPTYSYDRTPSWFFSAFSKSGVIENKFSFYCLYMVGVWKLTSYVAIPPFLWHSHVSSPYTTEIVFIICEILSR